MAHASVREEYLARGLCTLPGAVDSALLDAIEENICDLVLAAVARLPAPLRAEFEASNIARNDLPHAGLIRLYELSPRHEQIVVDALSVGRPVFRTLLDDRLWARVAEALQCDPNEMTINNATVRVDLPVRFSEHIITIALPAHQESSYFRQNIDPSTGCVLWIPIYDCGPSEGSLEVMPGSHKQGDVEHSSIYLKPEQKRHFRTTIADEVVAQYPSERLTLQRGDCALQHFCLMHRSAYNLREDRVRYTILARTSSARGDGFIPVSWTS